MNYKIFNFKSFGDERGELLPLEMHKEVPFDIKRVYFIYNTKPNVVRGKHAHKHLEQIIICLKGSCKFILDDGYNTKEILISKPNVGLYIGKNIWREMKDFTEDTVLAVIASAEYTEKEYIRDYDEFIKSIKG